MCCFFKGRRVEEEAKKQEQLAAQAKRAADGGDGAHTLARLSSGSGSGGVPLRRDSLREPLLQRIPEDAADAAADALPPQTLGELPPCVQRYLARAVRDGRSFRLITLHQIGRLKLDLKGGWKEATATERACPLVPAFVWSASARLAPLVSLRGFDALVEGRGCCLWHLWGALPAAAAEGRQADQTLLVRWLAGAACFPQALQPSGHLRWEAVRGDDHEAEAVLSWGGLTVRATFSFDRHDRLVRLRSRDFLRRLPGGGFDAAGEWRVDYSGHMLFGLSPRGPVLSAEESTPAGIFIPTQLESSWILPDGRRCPYASFTVARVTAE